MRIKRIIFVICLLGCQNRTYSDTNSNIIEGRSIYIQCTGCHAPNYHRTGPKHCNLLGRKAGHIEEFEFSSAMKKSEVVWTDETLDQFLKAPLSMIPGTSMSFSGISSNVKRAQLITFLKSLNEKNPLCR